MGWLCCGQPRVHEPVDSQQLSASLAAKTASIGGAKSHADGTHSLVIDGTESSPGGSPLISCCVSRQDTAASAGFFDALERFTSMSSDDGVEASSAASYQSLASTASTADVFLHTIPRSTAASSAGAVDKLPLADLPAELQHIVKTYLRDVNPCTAVARLWQYMDSSSTSMSDLEQLLAPMVAAQADHAATAAATPASYTPPGQPAPVAAPLINGLLAQLATLRDCEVGCMLKEGYKQVSFGALQLFYFHDKAAKKHWIKAHTILDEPLVNVLCLAREVDLVDDWNPAMAQVAELATHSMNEILAYLALWVPWPMSAPEVVVRGVGVDLLDVTGAVLLACGHVPELPPGVKLPPYSGTRTRLHVEVGGFRFAPLPSLDGKKPRTEAIVLMGLDASTWAIPDAVISFVLKVFAPLVYSTVLSVLKKQFHKKAGTKLSSRLLERRELYDQVEAHVQLRLAKMATAAAAGAGEAAAAGAASGGAGAKGSSSSSAAKQQ